MAAKYRLAKRQIMQGIYHGTLKANGKGHPTPGLELLHLGNVVGEVSVTPMAGDGSEWDVQAKIPVEFLLDGVQTFMIVFAGQTDILDRFSIVTGEPLEDDLRAEILLLREELDMLKRAFRRHCIETINS